MEAPHAEGLGQVPAHRRRWPVPTLTPTTPADTSTLQTKVDLARREIRLGRTDSAERTLTEVIDDISALSRLKFWERRTRDLDTIEGAAASLLGQVRMQQGGMSDGARAALSRAVELLRLLIKDEASATAQAWADYGMALDLLGRSDEATTALDRALDLGDASAETSRRLAGLMLRAGRPADAEAVLARTLASGPADAATLRLRGDVLRRLGRVAEAGRSYFDAGVDAVYGGHLHESLDLFRAAADLLPSEPDTHYAVGEVLRRLDKMEEALPAFDRALALEPAHPAALVSKGDVLRVKGDPKGALAALDAALAVRSDPLALAMKGDLLRAEGDYDGAMLALDQALALQPDAGWAAGTRGQVLRALDRLPEARDELRRAVGLAPDLAWAWAELAATEYALADIEQAVTSAAEALGRDPGNPLALAVTGLGHLAAGRSGEAAPALEKLTEAVPALDWAWASLAQARSRLGDDDGALAAADRALQLSPGHREAFAVRGAVLLRSGPAEQAVELIQQYVEAWPEDVQGWQRLAQARARAGDHPQAVRAYDRALQLRSDDPALHAGRARSLLAAGDIPAALGAYEEALRRSASATDLLEELADVASQTGAHAQAVAVLQRLGQEHPASNALRRHQARLELRLGRYEEMRRTLSGLDPAAETAEDSWLRGEAARLLEQGHDANRAFKRALDLDPGYLPAMTSLVYLHLDHDRINRARHYAERAVQSHGDDPAVLADLALVELAADRFEAAGSRVDLALQRAPDDHWALLTKARILTEQGEFQAATPLLERADELSPENVDVLNALGWCLENAAMRRAARETARGSPVRFSEPVGAMVAAAHDAYERSRRLRPDDLWLRRGVADTLDLSGRGDEARAHYRAIVEQITASRAYDAAVIAVLGWCYSCLRDHERAIKTYISALSTAARSKEARYLHFDLALVMLSAGHGEQAMLEYRRGIDQVAGVAPPRRRGVLVVAGNDLTAARATGRVGSAGDQATQAVVTQAVGLLDDALARPA